MKGSFFLSASALWRREMVRFVRQRSRIVGAFASPLIFWLLSVLESVIRLVRLTGRSDGLPGIFLPRHRVDDPAVYIDLFDDIDNRGQEGRVSSGRTCGTRSAICLVFGKLIGGTSLALMQGMLFMLMAPLVGIQ